MQGVFTTGVLLDVNRPFVVCIWSIKLKYYRINSHTLHNAVSACAAVCKQALQIFMFLMSSKMIPIFP